MPSWLLLILVGVVLVILGVATPIGHRLIWVGVVVLVVSLVVGLAGRGRRTIERTGPTCDPVNDQPRSEKPLRCRMRSSRRPRSRWTIAVRTSAAGSSTRGRSRRQRSSASCNRSSARLWSPVSRTAVRISPAPRARTKVVSPRSGASAGRA